MEKDNEPTEADKLIKWAKDNLPTVVQENEYLNRVIEKALDSWLFIPLHVTMKRIYERKKWVIQDEWEKQGGLLTDDIIANDPTIHAVICILKVVERTTIEEKIRWLVRAFSHDAKSISTDKELNEFAGIVDIIDRLLESDMAEIVRLKDNSSLDSAGHLELYEFAMSEGNVHMDSHATLERLAGQGLIRRVGNVGAQPQVTSDSMPTATKWVTTFLFIRLCVYVESKDGNQAPIASTSGRPTPMPRSSPKR